MQAPDDQQTNDPRTDDPRTDDPRTDDPLGEDPRAEILERAADALESGDAAQARRLAEPFTQSEVGDERHDALHLVAHAWYAEGAIPRAIDAFGRLADDRGLAVDWFQLATSCALAGDLKRAQHAFDTCRGRAGDDGPFPTPDPAVLQRWFAVALRDGGHVRAALDHVEELLGQYVRTGHTDDAACAREGLPPFSENVALAEELLRAVAPQLDVTAWGEHLTEVVGNEPVAGRLIAYARQVAATAG